MKKATALLFALPLALAACSNTGDTAPTTSSTATSTSPTPSTSSTTSSATPSSTSATMEPSTVDQAPAAAPVTEAPAAAAPPYVVECLEGTPGPALWSDGTTAYSQDCWEQRGGAEVAEAEQFRNSVVVVRLHRHELGGVLPSKRPVPVERQTTAPAPSIAKL